MIFNGIDFSSKGSQEQLTRLRDAYQSICAELSSLYDVEADPYLRPSAAEDREALLMRYLIAEEMVAEKAADRLRRTILWRQKWNTMAYYEPGCADRLFSTTGAEMYFCESGMVDREGCPYLIGRLYLCNSANMHPWRHLRAAIFVIERIATKLRGELSTASYLLDIGEVHVSGTYSGTGPAKGNPRSTVAASVSSDAAPDLLAEYGELTPGLSVLKAAMTIIQDHYPELMSRVVFVNSSTLFYVAFKVFSLWTSKRTRGKFHFVGKGWGEWRLDKLREWYQPLTIHIHDAHLQNACTHARTLAQTDTCTHMQSPLLSTRHTQMLTCCGCDATMSAMNDEPPPTAPPLILRQTHTL